MINMSDTPTTSHTMRLQLALNVENLEEAIEFYTKMFNTEPAKLRPGYANFAIADPPLKLVLFETGEAGTINHLGVETTTAGQVVEVEARLTAEGLETTGVDDTVCCFAEKTETWIDGPDNTRWEWYVRTGDSETMENVVVGTSCGPNECGPEADAPATATPATTTGGCCT